MRDPTYVAQLAATLDELSRGRAHVIFAIGNIAMLEQSGITWRGTRPIGRLREAHRVMRTLLVSLADPFTLRSWADLEVDGLPTLVEQIRLFGERVLPELA